MKEKNYWTEYGKELELEKEIEKLGVEKVESGEVKLPEKAAREMGIKPTVTADTPMEAVFKVAGVALTDDQIAAGKKKSIIKSIRWLAEWFIYELLKAGFIVKWVKGKFERKR